MRFFVRWPTLRLASMGGLMALGLLTMSPLLPGCGGTTTIESQLTPTRIVSFGDGLSDLGNSAGARYTVNDGTVNIWAERVALRYGLTLTASVTGGNAYAQGNSRIAAKPDAAGSNLTKTLKEQLDAFTAKDRFGATDVVLMSAGNSDIIAAFRATGATAATLAAVDQAARDYAGLVRTAVGNGAKYVMITGAYNLGYTPFGTASGQAAFLTEASKKFDERLVVELVNFGANVLYIDGQNYFNGLFLSPGTFGFVNAVTPVCTSVDAGAGIGTGLGVVSSLGCNTSTLAVITSTASGASVTSTVAYGSYVFADGVYLTPAAQVTFGDYAYGRLAGRW